MNNYLINNIYLDLLKPAGLSRRNQKGLLVVKKRLGITALYYEAVVADYSPQAHVASRGV